MDRQSKSAASALLLAVALACVSVAARAQSAGGTPAGTASAGEAGQSHLLGLELLGDRSVYTRDFKRFISSPARWSKHEWALFGGVLAATRVAYEYDYDVREHFVPEPRDHDYHDVEDLVPVGLMLGGTWLSSRLAGDDERFGDARNMVRASVLSTVSSLVYKLGLGRERPDEGVERDDWWSGGRSMPSGHTALAFAVGTVFAESGNPKRRWVRRVLGYGLGVGMLYLRLDHDAHWFSDTIPGAALGIATGRFVLNNEAGSSRRGQFFAAPLDGGAMLSFNLALGRQGQR